MFQAALKLQALTLKLKAEVKDPPGAVMHATLRTSHTGSERDRRPTAVALNPAVFLLASVMLNVAMALMAAMLVSAAMLVNAALAQTGKCEQLAIE
jgi:hypothetical protein